MGFIFQDIDMTISWNNSDLIVLLALAALMVLGLLFGAKKLAARIVGQFVAVIASLSLANVALAYVAPLSWYQSLIATLGNNAIWVNWVFFILFSGVIYLVFFFVWRLIFNHLIDGLKEVPFLSRIFGMILGICDWAVLLFIAVFFLTALPNWLGSNTPAELIAARDYLANSLISNKLVELFDSLIHLLGVSHP